MPKNQFGTPSSSIDWQNLALKNCRLSTWRFGLGLRCPPGTGAVVALVIASAIELLRRQGIIIPIPFMWLIVTVSVSASVGGIVAGLWTHLVWSLFVIYAALVGFGPSTLTGGVWQVLSGIVLMGILTIVQGLTKERNRWLTNTLNYFNRNLERKIESQTQNLQQINLELQQEIKQRVASQAALVASEQKFKAIFEQAAVGIVKTSLDKEMLEVNPWFCQITGYSAKELVGKSFESITHPDDINSDRLTVRQMRSGATPIIVKEKRYLHRDGSIVSVNLTAKIVYTGDRQPDYFLAFVQDITGRKQAELALQASEAQFYSMLNTCPFLVWISGTDGLCNFFNTAWLDYTGRTLEQELGTGWAQGIHPADLDRCLKTYQTAFAHRKKFRMEYRIRQHNGNYGWILDEGVPKFRPDGSFAGYIGTCVDISDRMQARQERELLLQRFQQERRFFESSIQQMPAGVFIVDSRSGKLLLHNQQALEILRFDRLPKFTQMSDYSQYLSWTKNGRIKTTQECLVDRATQGETIAGEEIDLLCGDNQRRTLLVNAAPIRNSQQQIIAAILTFHDITDLKQAQAMKLEAETKSILLKEIHHRIKNNLQVISALLDLQSEQISESSALDLLEKSQARIQAIAFIHEQLYSSSTLVRVNFANYVTSLTRYLQDSFTDEHQQIEFILALEPLELSIDLAVPCGLIINELVTNAIQHAFADRHCGQIMINFLLASNNYYLQIQDNGIGINSQIDINNNAHFLGLSLVESLATKQLKGNLEMSNRNGLVIQITFPQERLVNDLS